MERCGVELRCKVVLVEINSQMYFVVVFVYGLFHFSPAWFYIEKFEKNTCKRILRVYCVKPCRLLWTNMILAQPSYISVVKQNYNREQENGRIRLFKRLSTSVRFVSNVLREAVLSQPIE